MHTREAGIFWLLVLNKRLYLSVAWSSVNKRTNTKKHMCSKEVGLRAQNIVNHFRLNNQYNWSSGGGEGEVGKPTYY